MNIETVKSYILAILVIISLLLTFALWNYKPNYSTVKSDEQYLNEIDLGGTEQTKRSIIQPKEVIFHKNELLFGFENPNERQYFYTNMQDWSFDDYRTGEFKKIPQDREYIEMSFPTDMPIEFIKSMFTLNTNEDLPSWSFNRLFILFNEANSTLEIKFGSIDNQQQATFVVKDSSVFKTVWSSMKSETNQIEYTRFGSESPSIYLPKGTIEAKNRTFSVNSLDVRLLVDALFQDPSIVNPNSPDGYLSDGQRRIKLLADRRAMEFAHPMQSKTGRSNTVDLLERSLANVNNHKGWTDTYYLEMIDPIANLLRYRMMYDGYPVFNSSDLSIIETELINLELKAYRRPLFSLVNELESNKVSLPSGEEVINFLSVNDVFKEENIRDIQVGYKLTYFDIVSHTLSLDPVWYMNYSGNWLEIRVDQFDDNIMGGN